jgi:hypothetical protein
MTTTALRAAVRLLRRSQLVVVPDVTERTEG